MIKIFYNNKILFLTEKALNNVTNIPFSEKESIKNILKNILDKNNEICSYNIYNAPPYIILKKIKHDFVFIKAAGGIVTDDKKRILFIYKRKKWDLPKGKIDQGESDSEASIREVSEECGINKNDLKIIKKIQSMYHIYKNKNNIILKETIWFEIKYSGNNIMSPQIDEEITEVKWFFPRNIKTILDNTYLSIKDLIKEYIKI